MFALECMHDSDYCTVCPESCMQPGTDRVNVKEQRSGTPPASVAPVLLLTGDKDTCSHNRNAVDPLFAPLSVKAYCWSIDCSQLPYIGEIHSNKNEKKEKKMVMKRPLGTVQYTATATDTLNSIALKFNIRPNKLVELNKLFTHTIVPGQVLYVPDGELHSAANGLKVMHGVVGSPLSSDAEYDKLPDADLVRKAAKPIERVLSSTSEEEEPIVVKFLKMNCRYITDGKGVVGGVMIVTPNNVMFDPHKSDPLVIENGCEEYGLICPMEEVVSIALYNDISHMKLKDALPSDIPKDLCPLYRPGEWEDLSSEKDINPFSKFKSLNKEKRQNGFTGVGTVDNRTVISSVGEDHQPVDITTECDVSTVHSKDNKKLTTQTEQTSENPVFQTKKVDESVEDDFIEVVKPLVEQDVKAINDHEEISRPSPAVSDIIVEVIGQKEQVSDPIQRINGITNDTSSSLKNNHSPNETKHIELGSVDKDSLVSRDTSKSDVTEKDSTEDEESGKKIKEASAIIDKNEKDIVSKADYLASNESPDSLSPCSPEDRSQKDTQIDSESELKLWLLKRMHGPIEGKHFFLNLKGTVMAIFMALALLFACSEEKSKTPPMFLCIKVGKPMRKSFATQSTAMVQQYAQKRKQPEYWFAVPQERVDHLYTFFVQWSPEVYGKDAKEQGFVVVEKDELDMIDNFFSDPSTKSWEISLRCYVHSFVFCPYVAPALPLHHFTLSKIHNCT
ncbi:nuclear receptor coactivator 7-like [Spea bombifrons]|uniref:nuclear receptor coactivator 7-like n=1 Tax=Spea bombifrons TaxID=233779 RepID=UPI00234AE82A|nr:nuclear receptor coactivator 7-like [Spea bombifrons]